MRPSPDPKPPRATTTGAVEPTSASAPSFEPALPVEAAPETSAAPAAGEATEGSAAPVPPPALADRPLKPVGPARMKALREAIRSGRYPSDEVVLEGLERLIRRARGPS